MNAADVLPPALDAEVFELFGRTLGGQPQQEPRWKRGVTTVNEALGEAVGALYVARFFTPKAKAEIERLVENLRKAFAAHLQGLAWMTPETRRAALDKLAAVRTKVGYPDSWQDYTALEIVQGDAFGNWLRAEQWQHERERARLGKPSDRGAWLYATPQRVIAYNNPPFNEITLNAEQVRVPTCVRCVPCGPRA